MSREDNCPNESAWARTLMSYTSGYSLFLYLFGDVGHSVFRRPPKKLTKDFPSNADGTLPPRSEMYADLSVGWKWRQRRFEFSPWEFRMWQSWAFVRAGVIHDYDLGFGPGALSRLFRLFHPVLHYFTLSLSFSFSRLIELMSCDWIEANKADSAENTHHLIPEISSSISKKINLRAKLKRNKTKKKNTFRFLIFFFLEFYCFVHLKQNYAFYRVLLFIFFRRFFWSVKNEHPF